LIEEPDFTIPKGMSLKDYLLQFIAIGDTDIPVEITNESL